MLLFHPFHLYMKVIVFTTSKGGPELFHYFSNIVEVVGPEQCILSSGFQRKPVANSTRHCL